MRSLAFGLTMLVASTRAGSAWASDLCARDVRHRGAPIDLDVKGADLHDVFRLISDAGRMNLVIPDNVTGKVTLHLTRVAWDATACVVARLHHLAIDVQGNILVVTREAPAKR